MIWVGKGMKGFLYGFVKIMVRKTQKYMLQKWPICRFFPQPHRRKTE
jgi:hypothetical protein